MITSKGASGVTGAGFITLAATLSIVPDIPIQSIAILVGIDKFMSECRALTNLIGNGVACVVISISEGELDRDKLHETMAHPLEMGEALEPGGSCVLFNLAPQNGAREGESGAWFRCGSFPEWSIGAARVTTTALGSPIDTHSFHPTRWGPGVGF